MRHHAEPNASGEEGGHDVAVQGASVLRGVGLADDAVGALSGDDFVLTGSPANGLFRLYGDADGNATVNAADFLQFPLRFLQMI